MGSSGITPFKDLPTWIIKQLRNAEIKNWKTSSINKQKESKRDE
jgi:hypothetical protein